MSKSFNIKELKVILENDDVIDFSYDEQKGELIIYQIMNPKIIDDNFNELESRIENLETSLRLRYLGELNNLKSRIEKLEKNHE